MVRTARLLVYRVCLLLLSHSVLLHADVIPGRWEKVEAQAPGTGLMVIMKSGDRFDCAYFDCAYKELQLDTLVVETGAGEQRIPKVDIQRLETLVPDSVKDGTVKGVVIGAVALGVLGGLVGATVGGIWGGIGDQIQGALVAGAVGAGIGAGAGAAIGYGIDKAADNKRPEVLYIAN